jgi:hypothetical protein
MAMLCMRLRVVHAGTERVVVAGPAVLVAFERHWGIGIPKAFVMGLDTKVEHLAWVAHCAMHRAAKNGNGPAVKPFDAWLEELTDVSHADDEEADPDPLASGSAGTP